MLFKLGLNVMNFFFVSSLFLPFPPSFLLSFPFFRWVSLHSLGWSRTHQVDQAGFEFLTCSYLLSAVIKGRYYHAWQ